MAELGCLFLLLALPFVLLAMAIEQAVVTGVRYAEENWWKGVLGVVLVGGLIVYPYYTLLAVAVIVGLVVVLVALALAVDYVSTSQQRQFERNKAEARCLLETGRIEQGLHLYWQLGLCQEIRAYLHSKLPLPDENHAKVIQIRRLLWQIVLAAWELKSATNRNKNLYLPERYIAPTLQAVTGCLGYVFRISGGLAEAKRQNVAYITIQASLDRCFLTLTETYASLQRTRSAIANLSVQCAVDETLLRQDLELLWRLGDMVEEEIMVREVMNRQAAHSYGNKR